MSTPTPEEIARASSIVEAWAWVAHPATLASTPSPLLEAAQVLSEALEAERTNRIAHELLADVDFVDSDPTPPHGIERPTRPDPTGPARGAVIGCLLGAVLWGVLTGAAIAMVLA